MHGNWHHLLILTTFCMNFDPMSVVYNIAHFLFCVCFYFSIFGSIVRALLRHSQLGFVCTALVGVHTEGRNSISTAASKTTVTTSMSTITWVACNINNVTTLVTMTTVTTTEAVVAGKAGLATQRVSDINMIIPQLPLLTRHIIESKTTAVPLACPCWCTNNLSEVVLHAVAMHFSISRFLPFYCSVFLSEAVMSFNMSNVSK